MGEAKWAAMGARLAGKIYIFTGKCLSVEEEDLTRLANGGIAHDDKHIIDLR